MIHNYRGLAGHLRHNVDAEHSLLKSDWETWRSQYRATLRCRKCGSLWEVLSKENKDSKRCPRCEVRLRTLGKRGYEAWKPEVLPDPRVRVRTTKARWVGLSDLQFHWVRGDAAYEVVRTALGSEASVVTVLRKLGVTYKVFRDIAEDILGVSGYQAWGISRKVSCGRSNLAIAHKNYRELPPDGKAQRLKKLYGGPCRLEADFADALGKHGITVTLNSWQAVPVRGQSVPREADIKIELDIHHKLVVLCDGEAFHGPKFAFGDATGRISDDIDTAEGYFQLGYSVSRYSETELKSGVALKHLLDNLPRLRAGRRLFRLWHPATELWS